MLCAPAHAETLACHADLDAGAHYDLTASVSGTSIAGDVSLRYEDEENQKQAALKPAAQTLRKGSGIHFTAANANMEARVEADYDPSGAAYDGALTVLFHVENVPPVELPVRCTWN